jgi:hypothetical protein
MHVQNINDANEYANAQDSQRGAKIAGTIFKVLAVAGAIAAFALLGPFAGTLHLPAALYTAGTLAVAGGAAATAGALTTAGMVAAGGAVLTGLFSIYKAAQLSQAVNMYDQELDARRSAIHISRANELEQARNANLAAANSMPPANWRDKVQADRLEPSIAGGRNA